MGQEQVEAFKARRLRLLEKHAARDPEWQALERARAPKPLRSILAATVSISLLLIGLKGLALAYHGPAGYADLIAPVLGEAAPEGLLARALRPDPVTRVIAQTLEAHIGTDRAATITRPAAETHAPAEPVAQ